tara:strand:+ start:2113 stop:3579 length:1467 start_codon:yes stop_codon:yes gene_type:complete
MKFLLYFFTGIMIFAVLAFGDNARPNILLITSEDNGPELGCYGEPYVQTPNLDRLAEYGVRFDRAFVTQAGCSQSRSSILTGLYPHQNGQIGLATWDFRMYREDTPNVVRSLKDAGYRTGIIGKLHINPASAFPFDFKEIPTANFDRKKLGRYANLAGEFMKASAEPFFIMVNYPDAHRPFIPQVDELPEKPLSGADVKPLAYMGVDHPDLRQQTADHYNCISRLDTLIGDLLKKLKSSGKSDNTLVIYLGDHGADLLRGKRTCLESGLRIPLIASWPGKTKARQGRQELVSTIDLFPTILEASGADVPNALPGRSLLPLLRGDAPNWRPYLFAEWHLHGLFNFFPQRSVRGERYKLIQNLATNLENPEFDFVMGRHFPKVKTSVIESNPVVAAGYRSMKYAPEFELYDLENDPYEFQNLSSEKDHQDILERLKKQLFAWQDKTDDPLRHPDILQQYIEEITTAIGDGNPKKNGDWKWRYPEYFFESR